MRTFPVGRRPDARSTLAAQVRTTLTAVLVALLVVGATGAVGLVLAVNSLETVTTRWAPARLANAEALQALTNAETGLRGYQLTRSEAFLAPYHEGLRDYPRALHQLDRLVDDRAGQRLVTTERQRGQEWIRYAESQVAGAGPVGPHATGELEQGKRRFDRFRDANAAMSRYASERRHRAVHRAQVTRTVTLVTIGSVTVLLVLMGLALAARTVRRLSRPLEALRAVLGRMTMGDWSSAVPEEGPAELRAVATSVNQLAAETRRLQSLERSRARMDDLSRQVARQVAEHLDLDTVLEESVGAVGTALRSTRCFVRLAEGGRLGPIAAAWTRPGHEQIPASARGIPRELAELMADVASRRETLVVTDTRSDHRFAHPRLGSYVTGIDARSVLSRPLVAGGSLVGALSVLDSRTRYWTQVEQDFVVSVAEDVARAVSNAQLYSDQQEVVTRLQELDQAKSDFMSTVSHELRTPLTSIVGYLELLGDEDSGPLTAPQRRMLGTVERNAHRLKALVEDLLILSRIESGGLDTAMAPVDLGELVQQAAMSIGPTAEEAGVDLEVATAPDLGEVVGSADQLERVLLNLLSNAVKFTPAGGRVSITAEAEGPEVLVQVRDTGIGIPEAEQGKLFTRFFRASNATQQHIRGTGLGLAIVLSIVERHGGRVELQSRYGHGTTITVRLPARDDVDARATDSTVSSGSS